MERIHFSFCGIDSVGFQAAPFSGSGSKGVQKPEFFGDFIWKVLGENLHANTLVFSIKRI